MTRWHGPFETPNIAALAAASAAVIAISLCVVWWRSRRYTYAAGAGCTALACLGLIAATGSRAGAVAMVAGLVVLGLRRAIPPSIGCALALALGAFAWLFPLGARTAASVGDASITNRLDLWHAVLALIGDHPWSGVGSDRCMAALNDWYLPVELRGLFYSPINSVLALAAYFGVWAVGSMVVAVTLLISVLTSHPTRGAALPATALALLAIHGIGSLFQGHWYFRTWWWIAIPSALIVAIAIARYARMPEHPWKRWGFIALWSGVGMTSVATICALIIANSSPNCTRWCGATLVGQRRDIPNADAILVLAEPGTRASRGIEVRLRDSVIKAGFASAVIDSDAPLPAQASVIMLHQRCGRGAQLASRRSA